MNKMMNSLSKIALLIIVVASASVLPTTVSKAWSVDVDARIEAIERELRSSPVEVAVCINLTTGQETARFIGSWEAVRIPKSACAGQIITHNHPAGTPDLSIADVQMAELRNARQLRATGSYGGVAMTCVLTRPANKSYYGFGLVRPTAATRGGMWRAIEQLHQQFGVHQGWQTFFAQHGFQYGCSAVNG